MNLEKVTKQARPNCAECSCCMKKESVIYFHRKGGQYEHGRKTRRECSIFIQIQDSCNAIDAGRIRASENGGTMRRGKRGGVYCERHAGKNGPRWIPAARRQQHRRRVIPAARKFDAKKEVDTAHAAPTSFFVACFPWGVFRGRLFRGSHPGPAAGVKIAPARRCCCLDTPPRR